ncbi:MAG: siphovirus Gp157 family protein [Clostridia bacterium]|nr:siphovirus Gp157 family protein [Clostridia bacterium]
MNYSLYEIDSKLFSIIENGFSQDCIDEDGCIDEERAQRFFDELPVERNAKLEAYGCIIKQKEALLEGIVKEQQALAKRKKSLEARIDRMRKSVENSMLLFGQDKFETTKVVFSFRKSTQVNIEDESKIPAQYTSVVTTIKVDKNSIKEALKNGEIVEGASLLENKKLQIK